MSYVKGVMGSNRALMMKTDLGTHRQMSGAIFDHSVSCSLR